MNRFYCELLWTSGSKMLWQSGARYFFVASLQNGGRWHASIILGFQQIPTFSSQHSCIEHQNKPVTQSMEICINVKDTINKPCNQLKISKYPNIPQIYQINWQIDVPTSIPTNEWGFNPLEKHEKKRNPRNLAENNFKIPRTCLEQPNGVHGC